MESCFVVLVDVGLLVHRLVGMNKGAESMKDLPPLLKLLVRKTTPPCPMDC
jgi:hypothetical protein